MIVLSNGLVTEFFYKNKFYRVISLEPNNNVWETCYMIVIPHCVIQVFVKLVRIPKQ